MSCLLFCTGIIIIACDRLSSELTFQFWGATHHPRLPPPVLLSLDHEDLSSTHPSETGLCPAFNQQYLRFRVQPIFKSMNRMSDIKYMCNSREIRSVWVVRVVWTGPRCLVARQSSRQCTHQCHPQYLAPFWLCTPPHRTPDDTTRFNMFVRSANTCRLYYHAKSVIFQQSTVIAFIIF